MAGTLIHVTKIAPEGAAAVGPIGVGAEASIISIYPFLPVFFFLFE